MLIGSYNYTTFSRFLAQSITGEQERELQAAEVEQKAGVLGTKKSDLDIVVRHISEQIYAYPERARVLAERLRDGLLDQSTSWVYFIGRGSTGSIKIGWSDTPEERVVSLQTAHDEQLAILATVLGDHTLEHILHVVFEPDYIRGEWFKRSRVLEDFIRVLAMGRGARPVHRPELVKPLEPYQRPRLGEPGG